jgi:hypothetical protein
LRFLAKLLRNFDFREVSWVLRVFECF